VINIKKIIGDKIIIRRIRYAMDPIIRKTDKIKKSLKIFDKTIVVLNMDELWGYNFKEYFIKENMPEKISLLKKDLDEKSLEIVDKRVEYFLNFPLENEKNFKAKSWTRDILLTKDEIAEDKKFKKEYSKIIKKYRGRFGGISQEAFYFHHGLKFLSEQVINYIKNKDFLDIGAFKGESSLVFNEYNPSKVYAFEINDIKDRYYLNLKVNNIDVSKFEFINKGVSRNNGLIKLKNNNIINTTTTIKNIDDINANTREIEIVKLDDYFKDNKNIGLIKMDIEGAEYDAILGLKNIIKDQTPLMLIAIYHTPKEFFELKPLIENINPNYKFMIRNLCLNGAPHMETSLICIPKNIE
jgi:FkbM family methyltransferase